MKRMLWLLPVVLTMPTTTFAALTGSATVSAAGTNGALNHYTASITDTGTTTIGTFWYAWIPGQDYLSTMPTNIVSPAGWTAVITGGTPGDGYAIQWKATSAASDLATGSTLTGFSFDTADTLSQLQGTSPFFPGTPVGTSFFYQGAPFSGSSLQFVASAVSAVPEPASLGLLSVGSMLMLRRRRVV